MTEHFLVFAILCVISVKSICDISFLCIRNIFYKSIKEKIYCGECSDISRKALVKGILLSMLIDFIEVIGLGYVLLHTSLFVFIILFSIVLGNFLVSWIAILCTTGCLTKKQTTKIVWGFFSLHFGIFKNVVCILSFLVYVLL